MSKKVLFLCAETFPPLYAFLDHVFNRILPVEKGYQFIWVMPSTEVRQIHSTYWGKSRVWLIPKVTSTGLADLFGAYLSHLRFIQEATDGAVKEFDQIDAVQVRDDPAMAYVAWRLSRQRKIPFIYQISHLKEEENILYAIRRIYGNPIANWLKGVVGLIIRNRLLQKADLVLPISEQMRETLAQYGIKRERMATLPEGVDTSVMPTELDEVAMRMRHSLKLANGQKVLVYVGTLNRLRQLDFLLRVVSKLNASSLDAYLLMVGDGRESSDVSWLKNVVNAEGIGNKVIFTGWVARSQVPSYIRAADVGVSPIPPNFVYLNSSPIKTLEYLALEIPCVASDIPDQRSVIAQSGGGICVTYDETEFVEAITDLLVLSDAQRKSIGQQGRAFVKKHRDFTVLANKLVEFYTACF